ncbi:FAD-dependent oxidoreductase [Actinomycetospora endophytica]|uniref:FAD-dependent oxidoreductase n=1 Tax=Actinomycetospora endophytica TaxID=2291215 RepID=A0ABS8P0R7_9PSEU|nr:FAD-dependent oxidoreductase [Actinomycetospora endophytica]MCD2191847.1 FAD-dependent oxidoreductase [Actinomycetospora endophytica]
MGDDDVVIVGAGLAGLSTALFLALHGVGATVLERHPSTSTQPKARGQMPVIMEGFATAGVAEAIRAANPPGRLGLTNRVARSLAGPVLHEFTEPVDVFAEFSPAAPAMASQAAVEAAVAARARELGTRLRFRTRAESLTQDDEGVTLTVRDLDTDTVERVRAGWVVAADGHRGGLREMVGIGSHGHGGFGASDSVLFRADLSQWAGDDSVVLVYVQNPALPNGAGVLVSTDVPGEWVAAVSAGSDHDQTIAEIRTMIGADDLAVDVLGRGSWESAHRVADRYREGRVLLVGDAAHTMPPTGGQGGNTAMLDGYHLGWRLAAVALGQAGPGLLDSHDAERRPYGEAVADWQVANLAVRQRPDLQDAVGAPMDPATLLFGHVCHGPAVAAEPTAPNQHFEDPRHPSGRPGTRVPHVWLSGPAGRVSPRELLGPHFLVLTADPDGASAARAAASELGIDLRAHQLGRDLHDPDGSWAKTSGTGPDGTVLVRPDGIVAWRGNNPADLTSVLRWVLAR